MTKVSEIKAMNREELTDYGFICGYLVGDDRIEPGREWFIKRAEENYLQGFIDQLDLMDAWNYNTLKEESL